MIGIVINMLMRERRCEKAIGRAQNGNGAKETVIIST
jgi:hypothetical protein